MRLSRVLIFFLLGLFINLSAHNTEEAKDLDKNIEYVEKAGKYYNYSDEYIAKEKAKEKNEDKAKNKRSENTSLSSYAFSKGLITFFRVFFILACLVLLAFIVYQIVSTSKKKNQTAYDAVSINFAKEDLTTQLEEELGEGQYRLACRTLYLQLLQKLVEWRMIIWRNEKTNWDYYYESANQLSEKGKALHQITEAYDELWYGLSEPSLDEFETFKRHISQILE